MLTVGFVSIRRYRRVHVGWISAWLNALIVNSYFIYSTLQNIAPSAVVPPIRSGFVVAAILPVVLLVDTCTPFT